MSNQIAIQFPTQALLFDNIPVHFNSDAYLNATNIAKQFNKRVGNYLQTERTQEYIKELGDYLSVTVKTVTEQNQLVIVIQGGSPEQQGTWIHPKLAVDFARWLSPKFAVWCDVQIEKILGINTKYHGKKTTKDKRTALHEAIALLMTKSKYLHFKDCYKIIHQRFNVDHLDEIPEKQLPEAVQYAHGLMCGKSHDPYFENHANVVAHHMLWVSAWWRCYGESLRVLNPTMAGKIHDHFADGAFSASLTLGSERRKEIDARIQQDLPYMLKTHDLIDFFRHR